MNPLDLSAAFDASQMGLALDEAQNAFFEDEVPIGAIVLTWNLDRTEATVLARAHNRCEAWNDPTAHAEMLTIREACERVGAGRLNRATLYSTIEPCAMCAGAILHSRIERVVFGARDAKFGAAGSVVDLLTGTDPRLGRFNHQATALGGVRAEECAEIMRRFFQQKRATTDLTDPNTTISR